MRKYARQKRPYNMRQENYAHDDSDRYAQFRSQRNCHLQFNSIQFNSSNLKRNLQFRMSEVSEIPKLNSSDMYNLQNRCKLSWITKYEFKAELVEFAKVI